MKHLRIHFSSLVTTLLLATFLLTALSVLAVTNRSVEKLVEQELRQNVEYLNNQTRLSVVHRLSQDANALMAISESIETVENSDDILQTRLYQSDAHDFDFFIVKSADTILASALPIGFMIPEQLIDTMAKPPLFQPRWQVYNWESILILSYMIPLFDPQTGEQDRVLHGGIILNENSDFCQELLTPTGFDNIAFAHNRELISTVQKYDSSEMRMISGAIEQYVHPLIFKNYLVGSQELSLNDNSTIQVYAFKKAGTIITFAKEMRRDLARIFLIIALFALISSLLFVKVVTQPVQQLITYIKMRKENQSTAVLKESFIDEIDELRTILQKNLDEIHSSAEKVRALNNNLPNGFVFQVEHEPESLDRHFLFISEGVEKLHQCTVKEVLDNPGVLFDQIVKEDLGRLREKERESLRSMKSFSLELRFTLPDGTQEWRQINSLPHKQEHVIMWDGICIDITQRKKTETALQRALMNLEGVLSAASQVAIIATDTEGLITTWNSGAEKMLGYQSEEMVGKETPMKIHVLDEVMNRSTELSELYGKEILGFDAFVYRSRLDGFEQREWTYVRKDGVQLYVDLIVTTIRDRAENITGYLGVALDITKRKEDALEKVKLAEQLHQSQKMDAIGQLAGGVAHDFNNMLGGILGAGEILREGCSAEEQNEYIDMIITAANRAGYLTRQLLAFSRKSSKVSTAVSVNEIVRDTIALLQRTIDKNIVITLQDEADNSSVVGDNSHLHNALVNIGINASHAMPTGGELTYTITNTELDDAYCNASSFEITPGEYVEIAVRDTGCGMSQEILQRIFEPFFTTKEKGKGTGLGLAAVYGMVLEHDGAITVYSEEGAGTVFHIYLPKSQSKSFQPVEEEGSMHGEGTVLVIDDEELIRVTAKSILQSLGYTVLIAENGKKGLELYLERPNTIDIIILDMIMPVMGGRETLTALREKDKDVPVLIASGFAREEDLVALKTKNIAGFLHKPYRKSELFRAVNKALQQG